MEQGLLASEIPNGTVPPLQLLQQHLARTCCVFCPGHHSPASAQQGTRGKPILTAGIRGNEMSPDPAKNLYMLGRMLVRVRHLYVLLVI